MGEKYRAGGGKKKGDSKNEKKTPVRVRKIVQKSGVKT